VNRFALFFALALFGLSVDLATKSYIFSQYFDPASGEQVRHWWIDGVLGVQCSTNPGALFGIGKGLSWFFAALSICAICAILSWLFVWRAALDRLLNISLGLITGGILGNLYDRLGFGYLPGYPPSIKTNVRDWILFRIEGWSPFDPWPNFNIADSLLVTGAILLFINALFFADDTTPSKEAESDES
jgi:signal peptidase II